MTLNPEWDEVTMWDCFRHTQVTLHGRVTAPDQLAAYLNPQSLSSQEKEWQEKRRSWQGVNIEESG